MKTSGLLAGVLGAALGLLPIAPPEHVHEAEEQGHVHAVIHRHLQTHGLLEHHHADRHPELNDDDGPVLTLTAVYAVPLVPFAFTAPQIVNALLEMPPPAVSERLSTDVDILIHGPPRAPTPPRAPPSFPTA